MAYHSASSDDSWLDYYSNSLGTYRIDQTNAQDQPSAPGPGQNFEQSLGNPVPFDQTCFSSALMLQNSGHGAMASSYLEAPQSLPTQRATGSNLSGYLSTPAATSSPRHPQNQQQRVATAPFATVPSLQLPPISPHTPKPAKLPRSRHHKQTQARKQGQGTRYHQPSSPFPCAPPAQLTQSLQLYPNPADECLGRVRAAHASRTGTFIEGLINNSQDLAEVREAYLRLGDHKPKRGEIRQRTDDAPVSRAEFMARAKELFDAALDLTEIEEGSTAQNVSQIRDGKFSDLDWTMGIMELLISIYESQHYRCNFPMSSGSGPHPKMELFETFTDRFNAVKGYLKHNKDCAVNVAKEQSFAGRMAWCPFREISRKRGNRKLNGKRSRITGQNLSQENTGINNGSDDAPPEGE